MASDGGGLDELQCNFFVSSISNCPFDFPFPSPSEVLRVGTWEHFFLPFPIIMVSDDCGLDKMRCALLCRFNVELSLVVPFTTHSEAVGFGTWRSIFSSALHFLWPRMDLVWMSCNVHFHMDEQCDFCASSISGCSFISMYTINYCFLS